MKMIPTYLSSFVLLFLFSIPVYTQTTWELRMEKKARYYTKEIIQALSLPDSLEPPIFKTNLWVSMSIDSLYAADISESERKTRMRTLFVTRDSIFKTVLNKRQFLAYDDWQREKWEKKRAEQTNSKK